MTVFPEHTGGKRLLIGAEGRDVPDASEISVLDPATGGRDSR